MQRGASCVPGNKDKSWLQQETQNSAGAPVAEEKRKVQERTAISAVRLTNLFRMANKRLFFSFRSELSHDFAFLASQKNISIVFNKIRSFAQNLLDCVVLL